MNKMPSPESLKVVSPNENRDTLEKSKRFVQNSSHETNNDISRKNEHSTENAIIEQENEATTSKCISVPKKKKSNEVWTKLLYSNYIQCLLFYGILIISMKAVFKLKLISFICFYFI